VFEPVSVTSASSDLRKLALRLGSIARPHPLRVGIDGRTACGKTTFANTLANAMRADGAKVIRASLDGFHRPKAARYARGRLSPEGYYYDSRDYEAVRTLLLDPLGPGGNLQYRLASFDLARDVPLNVPYLAAPRSAVFLVDGSFLQRGELAESWDAVIFLDVPPDEAERRGVARDEAALGDASLVESLYAKRYGPAFKLYEAACDPQNRADAIVHFDADGGTRYEFAPGGRLA
jgi:uridine kinase